MFTKPLGEIGGVRGGGWEGGKAGSKALKELRHQPTPDYANITIQGK